MQNIDLKKLSHKNFKRKLGITKSIFKKMLEILEKSHFEKKKLGGKPNKLSVEQILLMTLEYWREYRTFFI